MQASQGMMVIGLDEAELILKGLRREDLTGQECQALDRTRRRLMDAVVKHYRRQGIGDYDGWWEVKPLELEYRSGQFRVCVD